MTVNEEPLNLPLAAVDMGSNSFRLELAQLSGARYRRIDYLKETVRLGAGLDAQGELSEEAMQRGLDCLRRFAQRMEGMPAARVRAVATQTLREARNRDAFLQRAQQVLGHPVEVISGREEARLIFAGVSHLQPGTLPRLVVDIGGRSTEMILGRDGVPQVAESFQVGSVSLSMRFFGDGVLSDSAFRAAQVAAGAELEEALQPFAPAHWREALGSSGTAGAASQLLQAAGVTDGRITPAALRWCIAQCIEAGHVERLQFAGLKADRRAVLPGGLAILYTLATHFGIEELRPAKGALRQGVVIDLHERLAAARRAEPHDARDESGAPAAATLRRGRGPCGPGAAHGAGLLRHLPAQAGMEARRELGWACDLHEMGLMVSHHDHHRHSAYLLAHVDAAGFSQNQLRRISTLVLAQRGGLRKVEAALAQPLTVWQVLCLRLAVIKCHARAAVDNRALRLRAEGSQAVLDFSAPWAQSHPRTVHLLQEEAQVWARQGPLRLRLPG